jgi:hypothetical protein
MLPLLLLLLPVTGVFTSSAIPRFGILTFIHGLRLS